MQTGLVSLERGWRFSISSKFPVDASVADLGPYAEELHHPTDQESPWADTDQLIRRILFIINLIYGCRIWNPPILFLLYPPSFLL